MGFVSFAGRVLFASVFILSAYQDVVLWIWFNDFGVDGGPAAKALRPKYSLFINHVTSHLGVNVPEIEMRHVIAATITLKGLGGLLFIFSSSFGAYLLLLYLAFITPVVYDFYNYDIEKPEFVQLFVKFTQNLALFGALLFFLGMKNSIPRRQAKKKGPKAKTV
ncbi:putative HR-like lesion-inducer [Dioscorea sansibarensis]